MEYVLIYTSEDFYDNTNNNHKIVSILHIRFVLQY